MTIDASTVVTRTDGNARINEPFAPERKTSGKKAKTTANVDVKMDPATSFTPAIVPLSGLSYFSSASKYYR